MATRFVLRLFPSAEHQQQREIQEGLQIGQLRVGNEVSAWLYRNR
jgi:hypothetical protein